MKVNRKTAISLSVLLSFSLMISPIYGHATQIKTKETQVITSDDYNSTSLFEGKGYEEYLKEYENKETDNKTEGITLMPQQASLDGNTTLNYNVSGRQEEAAYTDTEDSYTQWNFQVKEAGFYIIKAEFLIPKGDISKVQRSLLIDGAIPYNEAEHICFYPYFEEEGEVSLNSIGDEVWPKQKEQEAWQEQELSDSQGFYEEPLRIYLEKGEHTLSLQYVSGALLLGTLTLAPVEDIPTYSMIQEEYKKQNSKPVSGKAAIKFQAEESDHRNDSVIRREMSSDPKIEPFSISSRVLNTLGGYRWRMGNQSVSWKFDIEESGLYKINLKVNQSTDAGMLAYRQLRIDGEIPFQEMQMYQFSYKDDWYGETLSDDNKEPYLFYLSEGEHEITLTAKIGPIHNIINNTVTDVQYLSEITREITKITGTDPDPNYEYDLYRVMPNLSAQMAEMADRLAISADLLKEISNEKTSMENNYRQIVAQLRSFAEDVDRIPKALDDLNTAQANLGTYINTLEKSPLAIDYFEITSPEKEFEVKNSNFLERLWVTTVNFALSFSKDYDSIGKTIEKEGENTVLDVWIARGTEWGEVLKQMADEQFTPETGIVINLNTLPSNQLSAGSVNTLMLSITSGKAPDVALSVDHNLPTEFAFRDAAVDLTQFDGFEELEKDFYNESFVPYTYKDGIYAMPETMDFTVLLYRKDILKELGLAVPTTWNQVLEEVLPVLYENNMSFALPVDTSISSNSPGALRGFTMFLFQKQGQFYKDNGRESALSEPEAYQAFKYWTDLYSNYGVDEESNFFTRMRTGTIPIGIGNYTTYMQLVTSAPELYGRWGVARVPGMELNKNIVDYSVGTMSSTASMILKQSDKQEEAWKFLSWWMSKDTQTQYGKELEALIGESARWNTANTSAFYNLPWDSKDVEIIKEQMNLAKEQQIVPGGYFTGRHIINAWNRVILNNQNVRDALEEATKDIDKELQAKRKEFNLEDEKGE